MYGGALALANEGHRPEVEEGLRTVVHWVHICVADSSQPPLQFQVSAPLPFFPFFDMSKYSAAAITLLALFSAALASPVPEPELQARACHVGPVDMKVVDIVYKTATARKVTSKV